MFQTSVTSRTKIGQQIFRDPCEEKTSIFKTVLVTALTEIFSVSMKAFESAKFSTEELQENVNPLIFFHVIFNKIEASMFLRTEKNLISYLYKNYHNFKFNSNYLNFNLT